MSEAPIPTLFAHAKIRAYVINYLREVLPTFVARVESQSGYDDDNPGTPSYLPYGVRLPETWDRFDPTEFDHSSYPAIGLYINRVSAHRRMDVGASAGWEVQSTWSCTLSIACSSYYLGVDEDGVDSWETPEREAAMRNCQNLTMLVQAALLDSPSFRADHSGDYSEIELVDSSLSINFSEPIKPSRGPEWVAVAQITLDVRTTESIERPIMGIVRTASVRTELLQP